MAPKSWWQSFKYRLALSPVFYRFTEMIPAFLSYTILLAPVIIAFFSPVVVAYIVILFDLFWFFRVVSMSVCLILGYSRVQKTSHIDWLGLCKKSAGLNASLKKINREIKELEKEHGFKTSQRGPFHVGVKGHYLAQYRVLINQKKELLKLRELRKDVPHWRSLYHLVVVPTYNEKLHVLLPSMEALIKSQYPLDRVIFVLATEERALTRAKINIKALKKRYGNKFFKFIATVHPKDLPGENKVKSANTTYAVQQAEKFLNKKGIKPEKVIVTAMDCDTRVHPQYLSCLTFKYLITKKREHHTYQPSIMLFNRIWDVPAANRLAAIGSSFWTMIEAMRPERMRIFSSHAVGLKALQDVGYWDKTIIPDDSRIYWQTYFKYGGKAELVPLNIPVYLDAVLADNYVKTLKEQYLQLRRWSWGVIDIPYVVKNNLLDNKIPFLKKFVQTYRIFESFLTWATMPLFLSIITWVPLIVNRNFSETILGHNYPMIGSLVLTYATIGLIVTVIISLLLLPPQPKSYPFWKRFIFIPQWIIYPIFTILLGSLPALDSQTRLLFGKYLEKKGFRVTIKSKKVMK
ncbi:glycosyltransferase family 2 protein [Patescibacteria group bacterium]